MALANIFINSRFSVRNLLQTRNVRCLSSIFSKDDNAELVDGAPTKCLNGPRVRTIVVPSPRVTSVFSQAVNLSHSQVVESFYKGYLLLNGNVVDKKSRIVETGDVIDRYTSHQGNRIQLQQVTVLGIDAERTKLGKHRVRVTRKMVYTSAADFKSKYDPGSGLK